RGGAVRVANLLPRRQRGPPLHMPLRARRTGGHDARSGTGKRPRSVRDAPRAGPVPLRRVLDAVGPEAPDHAPRLPGRDRAAAPGRREPQAMVMLWLEYVGTAAVEGRAGHDPALDPEQQAVPVVVVRRPLGHDPAGTRGVERRLVEAHAGAPALRGGTVQLPFRHPPLNEHLV